MNVKKVVSCISYFTLAIAIIPLAPNWVLAVAISALSYNLNAAQANSTIGNITRGNIGVGVSKLKESKQETIIDLSLDELKQDCFLKIIADEGVNLTGYIQVNDKLVQKITENKTQIFISKLLQKGKNTIEIIGNYDPPDSEIKIEFIATNTEVTQQISGDGHIQGALTIYVE